MNPIFDVTGKTALVTGASSGFGAHFAKILSAHGAKVVLAARRMERLDSLVKVNMDVTNAKSISSAFDAAEAKFGIVDILSNNAGVADAKMALDIGRDFPSQLCHIQSRRCTAHPRACARMGA